MVAYAEETGTRPKAVFEVIEETDTTPQRDKTLLRLALTTIGQRAIAAIADLFTLATVGSAFWLWLSIHEPNAYQLVSEAMYACFVLAANGIVRRGKK